MVIDLMNAGIFREEAEIQTKNYFSFKDEVNPDTKIYLGKYQRPPMIAKDISTIKTYLFDLGDIIGISCKDKDTDNGYVFCREVYFHFGRLHIKQSIESVDYVGNASGSSLSRIYARLAIQAANERSLLNKENRFADIKIFPSRLIPPINNSNTMWRVVPDKDEEEIYATIETAIDNKIDTMLQNEQKYLDINDLEKIEEVLERLSTQYVEQQLKHNEKVRLIEDPSMNKADLRPLDFLYNSPREEQPNRISWKHVTKAYLIERILIMREYQRKISYAFNYFTSIKLKLTQDAINIGTKQNTSNMQSLRMVYIAKDEIRLIDTNEQYVFLEESLTEYKKAITRLLLCGTYYISQYERQLSSLYTNTKHVIDRGLVLFDLLEEECKFQYVKIEVIKKLLYLYEHTIDYVQVQAVGQLIFDFIEKRPRLQLVSEYFQGGYQMECLCLKKYAEFLDKFIVYQIREELKIDESCNNVKVKKDSLQNNDIELQQTSKMLLNNNEHEGVMKKAELSDPYIGRRGEPYTKKLEDILELEPMREEDLFLSHQKLLQQENKDKELKDLYTFISHNEGQSITLHQPYLLYENHQDTSLPNYSTGKVYSSLGEVVRGILAVRYVTRAMIEDYQPESGFAIAALEQEVITQAMKKHEEVIDFAIAPPSVIEREVKSIEIGSIADSAEVLIHTVKELAAALNNENDCDIDPVFLARLPLSTLNNLNISRFSKNDIPGNPKKVKISQRDWPSLLTFLCNIAEFIKLREHLLSSLYETNELTNIYNAQKEFTSNNSLLFINEPVLSSKEIRSPYVDPIICNECNLRFPIREFDPNLQHLLCFHSSKCIKLIVSLILYIGIHIRFRGN